MKWCFHYIGVLGILLFSACGDDSDNVISSSLVFGFWEDNEGWGGDFADYPAGEEEFYELSVEHTDLPEYIDDKKAIKISGNNHSADLFMYLMKPFYGLMPDREYSIIFSIDIASNAPTNAMGIGGAPGESVYFKVGALPNQPQKIEDEDGYYRLEIDKGNQAESGTDMITLGHIGVADDTEEFEIISFINDDNPFVVKTNEFGELWLIVGTDSSYEGITTLYYNKIRIILQSM